MFSPFMTLYSIMLF